MSAGILLLALLSTIPFGRVEVSGLGAIGFRPNADVSGNNTVLIDAPLASANLRFVRGTAASFRGADLRDADLTGANLQRADLSHSDLTGAILTLADLRGARVDGIDWAATADMTGSNIYGVRNAAAGFASWAVRTKGAVCFEVDEAWRRRLRRGTPQGLIPPEPVSLIEYCGLTADSLP